MTTTAAVVVTFNRRELLVECIDALLNQTVALDHIFIVDNASADGTEECVRAKGYTAHDSITYVRLPANIGGSGGFYEGMKLAYEKNYEWLWVMDDDAEPELDAFAALQRGYPGQHAVASIVCDAQGRPDTAHHRAMLSAIWQDPVVYPIEVDDLANEFTDIEHASFVGVAYSRSIIGMIGLPKREFFIHFDDYEYNTRLMGRCKIRLVKGSRIRHKDQAKVLAAESASVLGRNSPRTKYERLWLQYYTFRNLMWLRMQDSRWWIYPRVAPMLIRRIVGVVLYDDHKVRRIRFWLSAFDDARNNVFDNEKPRKILYG